METHYKPDANSKPHGKPTGSISPIFENYPLTRIMVVQIVLWYLDSGCSRHMTGDRARLINFVEKFIGTVRFGNDEYAAIIGYGDYKLGDTIISRVYYVEGLNPQRTHYSRRSKGRTVADSIAERLTRPTAYKFKTDCMILWNAEERDVVPPGCSIHTVIIDPHGIRGNLQRHTADLIEKYSVFPGPESVKNQESEKSPKEIIKAKKEQAEEKQDSTYSIRSTDEVDIEEFDLKSALFSHMNKKKSANKNKTNYRLYHALMEALIADEDAMDKEVADKVKDHKRKHDSDDDEDDDDDEVPLVGSNQGRSTKRRRSD
ncbi:hypothetical protein Tco_0678290, partial [Tanacetum coccineum]